MEVGLRTWRVKQFWQSFQLHAFVLEETHDRKETAFSQTTLAERVTMTKWCFHFSFWMDKLMSSIV